ncbi:MAG: OmpA family protein [Pseudomonadota bacterium]
MRKLTITACAALALSSALAGKAVAQVPLTINAGAAQWWFDDDRGLSDKSTPWVSAEWAFNDQWAAEVLYADKSDFRTDDGFLADVTNWQVGLLYYGGSYIGEPNRVRPYGTFSAGEIDVDAGFRDTVETTINAGGGLRWMWTRRFGARLEAKLLHSLDEHRTDMLLSAGFNFYFGDVVGDGAASAAAAAAAGAAAGGAALYSDDDADGDGVVNALDECPDTPVGTRVDSVGCPLDVEQIASIKLKVNFDFDSDSVEEQYFSDVGELAAFLKRFEDLQVDVEGHSDSTGPDAYNQNLSERRAQAVVDLLVNQHGIAENRLRAVGYGESQPIADNATREGRAENRRVMATLEVTYGE